MKKKNLFLWKAGSLLMACLFWLTANMFAAENQMSGDPIPTTQGDLLIHPINHATLALEWNKVTLYIDPVGGANRYQGLPKPDLILITHIHGDHFSVETLKSVVTEKTKLIVPQTVFEKLPEEMRKSSIVMTNNQEAAMSGIDIKAIAAYNTTAARMNFHPKGQGNGYALSLGGKRVYLSGDTEDIPEMLALKNIDVAFLCMNLPYTMTVEQAASAVREFRPKMVYPYHYRGADLEKFKKLVGPDAGVEVRLRNWY